MTGHYAKAPLVRPSLVDPMKMRVRRIELGLSYRQVDARIYHSEPQERHGVVSWTIENERISPRWQTIRRLARALRCAPDDLLRYPIAYGRGQRGARQP